MLTMLVVDMLGFTISLGKLVILTAFSELVAHSELSNPPNPPGYGPERSIVSRMATSTQQ